MLQKTLAKEVALTGVGVHSGVETFLKILPAPANSGITFVRTDVTDRENTIKGLYSNVKETTLCTVIRNDAGVSVGTIEHIMAALRACDIDNAVVELDGPEIPIMDGSSRPFIRAIDSVGTQKLDQPRKAIKILKTVEFKDGDKVVTLMPGQGCSFDVTIDFDSKAIGKQRSVLDLTLQDFETEASDARTFGFLHEVEYLRSQGLALGGSLDNAVVIDGDRVLNSNGTRFDNEFSRHKLLDAVGDIYLAGLPIIGRYESYKAGHALNNQILHTLFADPTAYEIVDFETKEAADSVTHLIVAGRSQSVSSFAEA
ncbi:MAG: UDP-3-O-[3-hydroxymyristoyl] N-acetylglucosamine deacetylase [Micavibrio sp.]|nr:UDP-3-O-[3-hydroxymyristoyl] N-acetylglucosamine deacetylase [Micavibrio sp.]